MVHGYLTRSDWYSLFSLQEMGKRYPLPSGREREIVGQWLTRHPASPSHQGHQARHWQELEMWLAGLERL